MDQNESASMLKIRRKQLTLTQIEVSSAAGISQSEYHRYESGEHDIRNASFSCCCSVLETLCLDPLKFFLGFYHLSGEEIVCHPDIQEKRSYRMEAHKILQETRMRYGLSQKQTAKAAGIALSSYKKFESGERNILTASFSTTCAVLAVLKLEPQKFYEGKYMLPPACFPDDLEIAMVTETGTEPHCQI
ncbi:MAG: transcriptional regulator [Ruminococcus sp.]|nr:transcriptional regulator [Ruminococcus sp.]